MSLKKYKFEREEDMVVFKVLLRIIKEDRKRKLNSDFNKTIESCYYSRKQHPYEKFETNILYWPYDAGLQFYFFSDIVYCSMLINRLSNKYTKTIYNKLYRLITDVFKTPEIIIKGEIEDFEEEIFNALVKGGNSEEKSKGIIYSLLSIKEGLNHKIPF